MLMRAKIVTVPKVFREKFNPFLNMSDVIEVISKSSTAYFLYHPEAFHRSYPKTYRHLVHKLKSVET